MKHARADVVEPALLDTQSLVFVLADVVSLTLGRARARLRRARLGSFLDSKRAKGRAKEDDAVTYTARRWPCRIEEGAPLPA